MENPPTHASVGRTPPTRTSESPSSTVDSTQTMYVFKYGYAFHPLINHLINIILIFLWTC